MAYVLSWVELCPSLADNYVARDDILIWAGQHERALLEELRYLRISSNQDVFRESHRDCARYLRRVLLRCERILDKESEEERRWVEEKRPT